MPQVTCITLFKYEGLADKIWAFGMMQFAHSHLQDILGLQFYKLMGSGKGMGFNPLPDWSTYAMLTVWDDMECADIFFAQSELFQKYQIRAIQLSTLYLHNIKSHGVWSGVSPFESQPDVITDTEHILVLTRATIKKRYLAKFWKYVPTSSQPLTNNPDLIYTKGIGEIPIIQMATISIWKDLDSIKRYAYQSQEHLKAVQMTRQYGWYREELFARFVIVKMVGRWTGLDQKSQ